MGEHACEAGVLAAHANVHRRQREHQGRLGQARERAAEQSGVVHRVDAEREVRAVRLDRACE